YLLNDLQVLRRMRGAMMYPAFMGLLCVAVVVFLLVFILPRFEEVFASRQATLPAPTRLLMTLSDSIIAYWYAWGGGVLLAGVIVAGWRRTRAGKRQLDGLMLAAPVLSGVTHKLCQSRTFRTMSILLEAGVPLVDAIEIVRDVVGNSYYRDLWGEV